MNFSPGNLILKLLEEPGLASGIKFLVKRLIVLKSRTPVFVWGGGGGGRY